MIIALSPSPVLSIPHASFQQCTYMTTTTTAISYTVVLPPAHPLTHSLLDRSLRPLDHPMPPLFLFTLIQVRSDNSFFICIQ
uniref:Expressed protein n=1 Tax=Echinococcus granulosus TaxID=6210 RepID=A0A068WS24_ECHGR|nr:expressed protein [Echinococcus granulosus]